MSIPVEILLITSGVGALQSAFFGIYLFSLKKGRQLANFLLAFLLFALAIRMTKSMIYYFTESHDVPRLLQNFGYAANLAILPLLWLYINAFANKDYRFRLVSDGLHLLPSIIVFVLSPFLTSHFWMEQHGYTVSLIAMGAYLPFCFYCILRNLSTLSMTRRLWLSCLSFGITIVWAAYTANFIFGLVPYITASVTFSFVIYLMTYLALKQSNIFVPESRLVKGAYAAAELEQCFEKLQHLMGERQPFRDPALTLPKTAKQLGVSAHLLSAAINKKSGQNFSDFVNSYRITAAQQLLRKPEYRHHKIAAIAFEIGFNSLSTFNLAFKKVVSMTPSEYRKQVSG